MYFHLCAFSCLQKCTPMIKIKKYKHMQHLSIAGTNSKPVLSTKNLKRIKTKKSNFSKNCNSSSFQRLIEKYASCFSKTGTLRKLPYSNDISQSPKELYQMLVGTSVSVRLRNGLNFRWKESTTNWTGYQF